MDAYLSARTSSRCTTGWRRIPRTSAACSCTSGGNKLAVSAALLPQLQPGGDPVKHAVEAEPETLVPRLWRVRVDARVDDLRDVRVAPGLADPPVEFGEELGDFRRGHAGRGLRGAVLPADLLDLAERRAHHVGSDGHQHPHGGGDVQAEPVERCDEPFGVARVVRA